MLGLLSLLAPYKVFIEFGAYLALAIGIYFYGHQHGAASVQAKWNAAEVIRKEAEWKRASDNDKRSYDASAQYQTASAAIERGHVYAATKRKAALLAPIETGAKNQPSGKAPALGDVRIYAAILDSLRSASGTAELSSQPTAIGPGATVQSGAGLSEAPAKRDDLIH